MKIRSVSLSLEKIGSSSEDALCPLHTRLLISRVGRIRAVSPHARNIWRSLSLLNVHRIFPSFFFFRPDGNGTKADQKVKFSDGSFGLHQEAIIQESS